MWSSGIVGTLIGIGIGVFATIFIKFHAGLIFSNAINLELDPLGLLSLIVTVILALYVTEKLNKKSEQSRVAKDLLIKRLGNLEDLILEKVRSVYKPKPYDYIQQVTKTIRTSVKEEVDLLVKYKLINVDNASALMLAQKTTELWHLLTFTPPTGSETPTSSRVEEGKMIYSTETMEEITSNLAELKTHIVDLQIAINSSQK